MNEDDVMRRYEDIIDLPRHVSVRHPPMPMEKRAAQFSPFAAVAGHEEAIRETARLREERFDANGAVKADREEMAGEED